MSEWHAVIKPPDEGGYMWTWAINNRPPTEHDLEFAILYGSGNKWGYSFTKRGAERKARFWMKQYSKRTVSNEKAYSISMDDESLRRAVNKGKKELEKLEQELERRQA